MRVEKIGYGLGTKDFEAANALRVMLGNTEEAGETILSLACNLDDMTGEAVGFAMEALLAAGALDVFTAPIGMKKSRPGVLLTCLCREEDREKFVDLLFRHTTTLGVRIARLERETLRRETRTVETPDGPVRLKTSYGHGVRRAKPEYEDLAEIARKTGKGLNEIKV